MGTAGLKFIQREEKKEKMGNCLKKSSSSFEVQNPALVKPRDSIDGVTFIRRDSFVEKDIEQHARSWFYQHFTNIFFVWKSFSVITVSVCSFWLNGNWLWNCLRNVGGCLFNQNFTSKVFFDSFHFLTVWVCKKLFLNIDVNFINIL